ncbi:MAG: peptidase T, partial [bacterium]
MKEQIKQKTLKRFLRYAQIDTQADENSETTPSTKAQFDLARILVDELKELGLSDISLDDNCYVMATLEASEGMDAAAPAIGFIAHLDTSPEEPGKNVRPRIIENYQGEIIEFEGDKQLKLDPQNSPELQKCIGHTIVTSDGTTLLGGDDKAGIAAIMTALEILVNNKNIKHGPLKICFTPDEEIGRGTKYFDIQKFGAEFAFTIDGSLPPEINKETFSANTAIVTVKGKNIHPGSAKNVMVNSMRALSDFVSRLPKDKSPETTEGRESFIHPHVMEGNVTESKVTMLLRTFDTPELDEQKALLQNIIEEVEKIHPKAEFNLEIQESYRNMREEL